MQNLVEVFESLPKPESTKGALNFSAVQLTGTPHRIGKDSSGWPALLLGNSSEQRGAQIRLEHLDIQHLVRCRIINTSIKSVEEGLYTVIRCTESDDELARYFLHIIDPILKLLGRTPTFFEISRTIAYLVELFRALTQPPIKSVGGLWAELFTIANSKEPKELIRAWHAHPSEKYDFNSGTQRIEVKSSMNRHRVHHFSVEQLTPPSGSHLIVASLFIDRSGAGTSLEDLVNELRDSCIEDPSLAEKLDGVVASALGSSLKKGLQDRFDRELAFDSLQFYRGESIPNLNDPLPWGISEVHFKADLSQSRRATKDDLLSEGGIFAALSKAGA